jgi:hypothetical protein
VHLLTTTNMALSAVVQTRRVFSPKVCQCSLPQDGIGAHSRVRTDKDNMDGGCHQGSRIRCPLKFDSWTFHQHDTTGGDNVQIAMQAAPV